MEKIFPHRHAELKAEIMLKYIHDENAVGSIQKSSPFGGRMKHIFIINPAAGKGRSSQLIPFIEECFKDKEDECSIYITKYPGQGAEIAREHAGREKCRIYAVGGDGTVNEAVNGIAGTASSLGVIPTGSGNDFIRSYQETFDIKRMIAETVGGREKTIDLARVNDKYFINISSIGFDANVVFNANKFKKVPGITGSMAYLFSVIYTVFKKKISAIKVDMDGEKMELRALLVAIANGRYYGGGIMPAPGAELDDGLLDVCLVREVTRFQILNLFPKYMKGLHGQIKEASFHKCRKISIESTEKLCVNIDGEIIEETTVDFEIIEGGINIILPDRG